MDEFTERCNKIIQNEILPRTRKLGIKLEDFPIPVNVVGELVRSHMDHTITMKDIRAIFDQACHTKKIVTKNGQVIWRVK